MFLFKKNKEKRLLHPVIGQYATFSHDDKTYEEAYVVKIYDTKFFARTTGGYEVSSNYDAHDIKLFTSNGQPVLVSDEFKNNCDEAQIIFKEENKIKMQLEFNKSKIELANSEIQIKDLQTKL